MAKFVPDQMLDWYLNKISGCTNVLVVCAGSPLTYQNCAELVGTSNGCQIAQIGMTSGCFSVADDTSGRSLTISAKTGASIVVSGSAMAVALVNTLSASVCYITTCTTQWLVSGGTVDIPSWKINLQDPTP